ncbi:hypothetical protein CLV63_103410 [Murinocardiopsis flavida]|uniref:WD40 repeat protein n=1 Tax=Murinocardiopsis flavida TaxID=645275 RepID=A0A2P8DR43_9ACTN|nr:hypothetical protein [Murinocardiopsis flavida]PSK99683.1 hypothetical protein CLV63_103410 [Murinocardiopsis flavida]
MSRSAAATLSLILAVLPAALGAAADQGEGVPKSPDRSPDLPKGSEEAFRPADPRIAESSGLAASRRHKGVYWTHNDSGTYGTDIFAVDEKGRTVATLTLTGPGVELRDWEAISVGEDDDGEPAIYVGDIGDNFDGGWPNIRVYRVPEPADFGTEQLSAEATTFTFEYADGARNAESMMIDPRDNRLYIASKEIGGGLYAAPEKLSAEGTNTLERIGSAPLYATDAAFAPDGSQYAIRTYWGATVYDAGAGLPGRSITRFDLPTLDQGESMSYTADGTELLVGSEGERSPVWRVPIPEDARPEPTTSARPEAGGSEPSGGGPILIAGGAGLALILILGIIWLARH